MRSEEKPLGLKGKRSFRRQSLSPREIVWDSAHASDPRENLKSYRISNQRITPVCHLVRERTEEFDSSLK
ncbi:hypothetical protein TNCV_1217411 [Trichonephila clavipes]|nr:hypothetical protein TNCV_1217411 [Trichonephila clavipes]